MAEVSVRVIGRFRPINKRETEESSKRKWEEDYLRPCIISEDGKNVEIHATDTNIQRFSLDYFLPETTNQATCFELVVLPIVKDNVNGINGTVFAYGQTGSGKTWSMFGPEGTVESRLTMTEHLGLIPRAATTIFDILEKSDRFEKHSVQLSVLEIYIRNELRDLLHPKKKGDKPLKIRESAKRIFVQGLKTNPVNSVADVLKYIAIANKHRTVSSTSMNATSSRSHSIFTLQLNTVSRSGSKLSSRISFCDLAGSEKVGKTGAAGKQMQEGMAINQSLTCLGQVITALVEHRKPSFRDTALTHVLKDSLVGNCKTTILVCLSPHRFNVMETINTLRFARRAKMIKNKFKVNKTRSPKELVKELKRKDEEIRILKLQLQRKAMKAVSFSLPAQGTPYIRFFYSGKNTSNFKNISALEDDIVGAIHIAIEKGKLSMLKTRLVIQDCDDQKEKSMEVLVLCDATSEYEKDALTKARDELYRCLPLDNNVLKTATKVELLFQTADTEKPALNTEHQKTMVVDIKKLKAEIEEFKVMTADLDEKNKALRIENDKLKINVEDQDDLLLKIEDLKHQLDAKEDNVTELQNAIIRATTFRQDSLNLIKSVSMDLPVPSDDEKDMETIHSLKDIYRDTIRGTNMLPMEWTRSLRSVGKDGSSCPSGDEDWEGRASGTNLSATNHSLRVPRASILSVGRKSIRETLSARLKPGDFWVELKNEQDLMTAFKQIKLELMNIHDFYLEAKNFEEIEENKESFEESFKVAIKIIGEFTQQIGATMKDLDTSLREIASLNEKVETLSKANEQYAHEAQAYQDVLESMEVGRHSSAGSDDSGYGQSLAAQLGFHSTIRERYSEASIIPLEEDYDEERKTGHSLLMMRSAATQQMIIEELKSGDIATPMKEFGPSQNADHRKASTMSRNFSKQEKSDIMKLLIKEEMALKGEMGNLLNDESIGAFLYDYSSGEEEEEKIHEIATQVSKRPLIDWNLAEVIELLNVMGDGRFRKFIPEFKRTLVTGEVLLSLQRTELKHEYRMNRKEITFLFQSLFQLDPNFKARMTKKYKKKAKKKRLGTHDQMIMATVDWEGFLSKQSIIYSWQMVVCCVGEVVRLKDGREGRILFKGAIHNREGVWLGLELTKGEGLNDGKVKGVRYFKARSDKHGIFIREQKVKEKLDLKMYQPPRLNRSASSLDLASPRRNSTITVFGAELGEVEYSTNRLLNDIDRAEEISAKEADWYLSTSSEELN